MEGAKLKALKQIFPELRNFEGRFFGLFLEKLKKDVEDWAIWARLQLQTKKCYNIYTENVLCLKCKHFGSSFSAYGETCEKHPELGQTWGNCPEDTPGDLKHPNTGEWYWCIKECPDFAEKEE